MNVTITTAIKNADGSPFHSASATYANIDPADAKQFVDLIDEYQADAQKVLGAELLAPSADGPGYDMTFELAFSDGTPGKSLSLTNVSYKVLHTLEHILLDKGAAMLAWGHAHAKKHNRKSADKVAVQKALRHVDIR